MAPPTHAGPPPTDPANIWQAVLAVVKARPSLNWIESFKLLTFEAGVATIAPLPRQDSRVAFASNPRSRATLESMLSDILQAPVRLDIATPDRRAARADDSTSANAATAPRTPGSAPSSSSRLQRAMDLPTVRQLLEVFDVSVVEVRDDTPIAPPPEPETPESADALPSDSDPAEPLEDE